MGSYMTGKKKAQLLKLAMELGAEVSDKMTVPKIVRAIRDLGDEDEEFNAALLDQIIEDEREGIERENKRLEAEREERRLAQEERRLAREEKRLEAEREEKRLEAEREEKRLEAEREEKRLEREEKRLALLCMRPYRDQKKTTT